MKILLAVPYQDVEPYILPNLGLGYLASALRKYGHDVNYVDCLKERIYSSEWESLLQRGSYDVVGIQMFSYTFNSVREMMHIAKKTLPDVVTVVGGPHINAIPKNTLQYNQEIDYGIHGEGERAFPELVNFLQSNHNEDKKSSIPNLVWRNKNNEVQVNNKAFIDSLDDIEMPAWDLMDPRTYPHLSHGLLNRAYPIAPMFSTRGCPFNCTFCSAHPNMGARIRKRIPSKVVDEIEYLVKEYGVKEIHFEDDNFTFYKEFVSEVCQLIIDRGICISWACPNGVRLDSLDAELLKLMEKSGCYSFAVGIESGSDRVLKLMKKGTTADKIRQKIRLIAETTKIRMTGFIIIGFPGETEDDLKKTEELVLEEPLHRVAAGSFIPLPATKAYDDLVKEGKLPERYDWNKLSQTFSGEDDVFTSGSLTQKKISDSIRRIHL
ncbi:MAG: B12-binding domain-containing radical SAM protein, partial [Thermodesulfobacteriota bacterium]